MKVVAAIHADLDRSPIGTASRLGDALEGTPILACTVRRLAMCRRLDGVFVSAPSSQADRVQKLVGDLGAQVVAAPDREPAYRRLVTSARKWSLDGWRGGLGGCCAFDECTDTGLHSAIGQQFNADAVMVVHPGAALIDPEMADRMIEHYETISGEMRMTFAQSPPGLVGTIFQTKLLAELVAQNAPPGWTLNYKPDDPCVDLAFRSCCFSVPQSMRYAAGRLTADTNRSLHAMREILRGGMRLDAETICRWLVERDGRDAGSHPREVEIELTTEDSLPQTLLRPRNGQVGRRGPMSVELVEQIASELAAQSDDALVVLGGCGDPILHPQFAEILHVLRKAGVFGIAVCSSAQRLDTEILSALIQNEVDVLAVNLDAMAEQTYSQLNGGSMQPVLAAIQRLAEARLAARQPTPILAPRFTKCQDNLGELDAFYDHWIRRNGCAVVENYSDFAGILPDRSVMDMSPPTRRPCRRLGSRCMILADGTVVACDQDVAARQPLGHLAEMTLQEAWTGPAAQSLRQAHLGGGLADRPVCLACREWHRP